MRDIWKKFEENELSHSWAHHLMAIHDLLKTNGYARAVDVARDLNITRGSATITLNKLKNRGYVVEDGNKFLRLSESGKQWVNSLIRKRHILTTFLTQMLEFTAREAEIDACKIEHLISREMAERLLSITGYYLSDNDEAKRFKNSFKEFFCACQLIENCEVCERECFFNGKLI